MLAACRTRYAVTTEIIRLLKDSFALGHRAAATLTADKLDVSDFVPLLPKGTAVAGILDGTLQVGSALSERAIPLQSAYCGAKHAINGFTSSLRCELLHEHSGVRVTVVQMPAVNTPQFSWVRSKLPRHPQPVPPIYQPEVAARGVLYAADHPGRRQYWVGASTTATIVANKFVPAVLDRYLARTGYDSQQTGEETGDRRGNLWQPLDGTEGHDYGAHGTFDDRSHVRSAQQWFSQRPRAGAAVAVAAAGAGALLAARRARRA